jgi:alpha-N-arabinofuranosidase
MRRGLIGVNHLAYGKDGYGLLLTGSHTPDPALVDLQRKIGFGSLRYPGGCGGTHNFDWKRNAGLVGTYRVLGVVEFMDMCEAVGAAPLLGISAMRGTPQEAAEYVEFLNSPADAAHPWAMKRATRGRTAPWNAVWFEYGNETYHGTHARKGEKPRHIAAADYAESYLAFRDAMRAADPKVKLGAVLSGFGNSPWDLCVLDRVGAVADFVVVHSYCDAPERETADEYLELFDGRKTFLTNGLARLKAALSNPNTPIALTEFNTRQNAFKTLTAALVNAQTLMAVAAEPRVAHANYWQFVNEGFGMVRGTTGAFVQRPNALVFGLYAHHALDTLVPVEIQAPPHAGAESSDYPEEWRGRNVFEKAKFHYANGNGPATGTRLETLPDGETRLHFLDDRQMNFFHVAARAHGLPKGRPCDWRLSCELRTEGTSKTGFRLDIGDGRGWLATKSCISTTSVNGRDWIPISCTYAPLKDNPGSLVIRFRREGSGRDIVCVRNLRVEAVEKKSMRNVPVVDAQLSRSADGRRTAWFILNRSLSAQEVVLPAEGTESQALAESLVGPSAYATNEEAPDNVRIVSTPVRRDGDRFVVELPPHSATGVRIRR